MSQLMLNVSITVVQAAGGRPKVYSGLFRLGQAKAAGFQIPTQPHAVHSIQIEGETLHGQSHNVAGKALKLVRVGKSLVLRADDSTVLELLDFYETPGAILSGQGWMVQGMEGVVAAPVTEQAVGHDSGLSAQALRATESLPLPLSPAWVRGWAAGLTSVALATASKKEPVPPPPPVLYEAQILITGKVVYGFIQQTHDLVVQAYAADGQTLLAQTEPDALGQYQLDLKRYVGGVLLKVVSKGSGVTDYIDTATGKTMDVVQPWLSASAITSTASTSDGQVRTLVMNINPLTTYSALLAGVEPQNTAALSAEAVLAANQAVAQALGLTQEQWLTLEVIPVNDNLRWVEVVLGSAQGVYASFLAALSGLAAHNGQSLQEVLDLLVRNTTFVAGQSPSATWSPTLRTAWFDGAVFAQAQQSGNRKITVVEDVVQVLDPGAKARADALFSSASIETLDLSAQSPFTLVFLNASQAAKITGGQLQGLSTEQLRAIAPEAIEAWGLAPAAGQESALLSLSPQQLAGLSMPQLSRFAAFSFETVRALAEQGAFELFKPAQIGAVGIMVYRMTNEQVAALSAEQLSGLTGDQAATLASYGKFSAFDTSDALALGAEAFQYFPDYELTRLQWGPAEFDSLSLAHLALLSSKQAQALSELGAFVNLTPQRFVNLSYSALAWVPLTFFDGLTPDNFQWQQLGEFQLRSLKPEQLGRMNASLLALLTASEAGSINIGNGFSLLPPEKVGVLKPEVFTYVPAAVLATLSPSQVAALTVDQIKQISEQKAAAMSAAGNLSQLALDQVLAFPGEAFAYIPPEVLAVRLDATSFVQLSSSQLGKLTQAQAQALQGLFEHLSKQQLLQLSPDAIGQLPLAVFNTLTAAEINRLSFIQLSKLNPEQVQAMAADQRLYGLSGTQFSMLPPLSVAALPASQIALLPNELLQSITAEQAQAVSSVVPSGFDQLTAEQVLSLSAVAMTFVPVDVLLRLSADQVAQLSSLQLRKLSTLQLQALVQGDKHLQWGAQAISDLAVDAIGALQANFLSKFTTTQLSGLSASQAEKIASNQGFADFSATQILSLQSSVLSWVTPEVMTRLTASDVASLSRAHLGILTAEQAAKLGDTRFALLQPEQVLALNGQAYPYVGDSVIGQLSAEQVARLNSVQLAGLTAAHISALANQSKLGLLSAAQWLALGVDITALTAAQLAALSTEQLAALSSQQLEALVGDGDWVQLSAVQIANMPNVGGLSASALARFLPVQLSQLTSAQASRLSLSEAFNQINPEQALALPLAHIPLLPPNVFATFGPTDLTAWGGDRLEQLTRGQIDALARVGALAQLSAPSITSLGTDIATLSAAQVNALTNAQLQGLSDAQIAALAGATPNKLLDLLPQRLQYLGANGIAALQVQEVEVASATGAQGPWLNAGDTVLVKLTMSSETYLDQPTGASQPVLNLKIGSTIAQANFKFLSAGAYYFEYQIKAGDNTSDGIGVEQNGLDLQGSVIRSVAMGLQSFSNFAQKAPNAQFLVDTDAPIALSKVHLRADTGIVGDGITSDAVFTVEGIESGARLEFRKKQAAEQWSNLFYELEFSTDGLSAQARFLLPDVYEKGSYEFRQIDKAGNPSAPIDVSWDGNVNLDIRQFASSVPVL